MVSKIRLTWGRPGDAKISPRLDADVGKFRRIFLVSGDEVSLRGDMAADYVGDVIGEAQILALRA